jgi:WD40 repeat protein
VSVWTSGSIRLWDVATGNERPPIKPWSAVLSNQILPLCFSPDGQILLTLEGRKLSLFSVSTSQRVGTLSLPESDAWGSWAIEQKALSRGGISLVYVQGFRPLLYLSKHRRLIWAGEMEIATGKSLWRDELKGVDAAWLLSLAPGGKLVAYVPEGTDHVALWDTSAHSLRGATNDLAASLGTIWKMSQLVFAFSPDDRRMALLAGLGYAAMIDTTDAKVMYRLAYQSPRGPGVEGLPAMAFSSDSRILAVGLPGGGVQLVDVASGQTMSTVSDSDTPASRNSDPPSAMAFSSDGRSLIVATPKDNDSEIKSWDVARLLGNPSGG